MKKAILSVALMLLAGLFADAMAQGHARMAHRRVAARHAYHHPSPGRYSPAEKQQLRDQKEEIKFLKREARYNGYVSPREKRKIHRAEQRYHTMKYHAKYR